MNFSLPFAKINDIILEELIQEGPYSVTLRGYQPGLRRPVFIKLLKPHIRNHAEWVARFEREARICARLKHPNIVDVYTLGEQQGYTYMVLEYVSGLSLKELLEKERKLPWQISVYIAGEILKALGSAHAANVVHRDLKPGNVMLADAGQVKVTDFGLAYLGEEATLTRQDSILGTPAYLSPEQVLGEPVSPASDFFSLGATLYEMISGIRPFAAPNYSACIQKILNEEPLPLKELDPGIPESLSRLVEQLLRKEREERPESAEAIRTQLEKLVLPEKLPELERELAARVAGHSSKTPPEKRDKPMASSAVAEGREQTPHSLRRWWRWLPALVLLLFLGGWFLYRGNNRQTEPPATPPPLLQTAREQSLLSDSIPPAPGGPDSIRPETAADKPGAVAEKKKPSGFGLPGDSRKSTPGGTSPTATAELPKARSDPGSHLPGHSPAPTAVVHLQLFPWAAVILDGATLDSMVSEKNLTIPAGPHQFIFTNPRFPPKIWEPGLAAGDTVSFRYSFLNDAAFLAVEARPWARVSVDGRPAGTTPLERPIVLPPGKHTVVLQHPDFPPFREVLTISAGDTVTLRKRFLK